MAESVSHQSLEAPGDCALVQMRQPGDLDKGYLHSVPLAASRLVLADELLLKHTAAVAEADTQQTIQS